MSNLSYSHKLDTIHYDIRGPILHQVYDLEKQGHGKIFFDLQSSYET